MNVVIFEDDRVERLFPVTAARPAYAISCGSFRLVALLAQWKLPMRAVVRPQLLAIELADYPEVHSSFKTIPEATLLVNARLVPSIAVLKELKRFADLERAGVVRTGDVIAAAYLPAGSPPVPTDLTSDRWNDYVAQAKLAELPLREAKLPLFNWPHDVVRHNMAILRENLEYRLAESGYRELSDGVFAAEGAVLGQYVVSNTRAGPIVLERNASIGPYCYLSGPAWLGEGARVIEHAAIKDGCSLGHTTKIGGEVEASIIEPYTNKQHHGFLGHSYLGSWINLGAGTCNSDLKNTYGEVKVEYQNEKVATGMQFVGCFVGDYTKTAINTGIFTGKVLGVCSMVYGFVTTNVPSFTNYARLFGQTTELPPEIMIAAQQRMFLRRNVQQRPCDIQLLHDLYKLTRHERQIAGEPLVL